MGLLFIAAGNLWLTRIADLGGYAAVVLPGMLVVSVGMGLTFPAVAVAVTSGAEQGSAGALLTTNQQIGTAAGLSPLATLAAAGTSALDNSLVAGYQLAFIVAAGMVAVFFLSGRPSIGLRTLAELALDDWGHWQGFWGCGPAAPIRPALNSLETGSHHVG